MPRYFLHLRDGMDEILDDEGVEMSAPEISGLALVAARDCIAEDARSGRIDLRHRIDVHNERDDIVHTLNFADAVAIIT